MHVVNNCIMVSYVLYFSRCICGALFVYLSICDAVCFACAEDFPSYRRMMLCGVAGLACLASTIVSLVLAR